MPTKTVQVTFSAASYDSDLITVDRLRDILSSYFDGSAITVESVKSIRPAGVSKIEAIKIVRSLYGISLFDAKLLVDLAVERGSVRWGDNNIEFDSGAPDGTQFFVVNVE